MAPGWIIKFFGSRELAVKLQPANKIVVPLPLMLPTVCVPESTWNTAAESDMFMSDALSIWPVDVNSNVPLLITVGPAYVFEVVSTSVPEPVLVSPPSPLKTPETVQAKPFESIVAPPAPIVAGTANFSVPIACSVPP